MKRNRRELKEYRLPVISLQGEFGRQLQLLLIGIRSMLLILYSELCQQFSSCIILCICLKLILNRFDFKSGLSMARARQYLLIDASPICNSRNLEITRDVNL